MRRPARGIERRMQDVLLGVKIDQILRRSRKKRPQIERLAYSVTKQASSTTVTLLNAERNGVPIRPVKSPGLGQSPLTGNRVPEPAFPVRAFIVPLALTSCADPHAGSRPLAYTSAWQPTPSAVRRA
jgi:hypothetical protein